MERLIDKYLPADYHDTFVLKSRKPAEQIIPKELIKKIFNHSPAWLNFLMKVRNILVKPLGLETGKVLKTEDCIIDITTVVQYHNALGKAYFFFIKPFHKMIVPRVAKELI